MTNLTVIDLYTEILKQGLDTGGEPEYIEVRTPIKDDPKGWFIAWQWMHHDGLITQGITRGETFDMAAQKMLENLIGNRQPTEEEQIEIETFNGDGE